MYLYGNSEKYLTDKNLHIGVRNYVLDSAKSVSMTGTGRDNDVLSINSLSKPLKQFTSEELSHVILSFNWSVSEGASGSVEIQFSDTPWNLDGQILKIDFSNAKSGRFCKKFNLATKKYYGGSINATGLAIKQNGFTGTFTVDHIKLEIGDVPTQWCPAPEDLAMKSDTFSGGVNLFRNTDKLDEFWGPSMYNNGEPEESTYYAQDVNHELIATKYVFHAWGSKASDAGIKTTQQIYFEQGVYTISFLARNNGTDYPSFRVELFSDYTDQRDRLPLGSTSVNLTNVWQRYSITFKIDQAGTYGNWRLTHWSDEAIPGGSLFFANLKLERGSVATDWCPASEDYVMKSDYDKLLGIRNLLTDDEMNIANALKSPSAQGAISNMSYSNGVSYFHYRGIADYERINWQFAVTPNTNYRMEIVANSTNKMTFLDHSIPYIEWGINSKEDLTHVESGDIGNWHLPLPWSKGISGSITFNSGSYSKLYLISNWGFANDGIDTDITLQIKLFRNDPIQTQIDQLRSQIEQLKQK